MEKELKREAILTRRHKAAIGILAVAVLCQLWGGEVRSWLAEETIQAIVLPGVGPVYMVENPWPELVEHELCHDAERLREGNWAYYSNYYLKPGGAAAEEARCGAPAEHWVFKIPFFNGGWNFGYETDTGD